MKSVSYDTLFDFRGKNRDIFRLQTQFFGYLKQLKKSRNNFYCKNLILIYQYITVKIMSFMGVHSHVKIIKKHSNMA